MYRSLEARVPLLDHNIVEFALNLNSNLKGRKGVQKYILKEILYEYIPKNILNRPKWGFSIPLNKWLKNDLKFLIVKFLNKELIQEQGIMDYKYVSELKNRYFNGEDYLYNRIWALIILNKFISKSS